MNGRGEGRLSSSPIFGHLGRVTATPKPAAGVPGCAELRRRKRRGRKGWRGQGGKPAHHGLTCAGEWQRDAGIMRRLGVPSSWLPLAQLTTWPPAALAWQGLLLESRPLPYAPTDSELGSDQSGDNRVPGGQYKMQRRRPHTGHHREPVGLGTP